MWAFHGIAAQGVEQFLAVVIIADTDGIDIIKDAQRFQLRLAGLEVRRVFDENFDLPVVQARYAALLQGIV